MIFSTRKHESSSPPLSPLSREELIEVYRVNFGFTRADCEYIFDHPEDYQSAVKYVSLKRKLHDKQRAYRKARLNRISKRRSHL